MTVGVAAAEFFVVKWVGLRDSNWPGSLVWKVTCEYSVRKHYAMEDSLTNIIDRS